MRTLIIPISIACLSVAFTPIPTSLPIPAAVISSRHSTTDASSSLYENINLQQYGLSKEAFDYAYKGYQNLLKKNMISRSDYLTICDFSQPSRQKRLYIIDIASNELVLNTYVAHGKNSGAEYATRFSNSPSSLQSSLGFYITQDTYVGEHGLSLKINGVDRGFNDKASRRHIVIHGANYIDQSWLRHSPFMGRSYGCPAVPANECLTIINTIKNGTCLFIYHPYRKYLKGSKILNG